MLTCLGVLGQRVEPGQRGGRHAHEPTACAACRSGDRRCQYVCVMVTLTAVMEHICRVLKFKATAGYSSQVQKSWRETGSCTPAVRQDDQCYVFQTTHPSPCLLGYT
jgi:hypothetical protein